MWAWSGIDPDYCDDVNAETPSATVTENPVVGVLYGPSGDVLSVAYERPFVKFGFIR